MQLKLYMIIRVADGKVLLATISKSRRDAAFDFQWTETERDIIKVDLDVNEWVAIQKGDGTYGIIRN